MATQRKANETTTWKVIARKPMHRHVSGQIDSPGEAAQHAEAYRAAGYTVEVLVRVARIRGGVA